MQRVISAGGVVFRRKGKDIQVLMIKDSYGKNAFPKGHVERGETVEQTALRETAEEVNLEKLKVVRKIGTNNFWFTQGGERIHKTVHYFLMESEDAAAEPSPQWEIDKCFWVRLEEFPKIEIYKNLGSVVKKAVKFLYEIKAGMGK
ncbi:NUDIX domain-containing protein [Patescibacteria group bacterium]|nr:NUDIX domain-containing protein [Patescibacteria group bacterium]MBU1921829.1 NUDIX domain-containing protein [Patescibacteria group bacterium]